MKHKLITIILLLVSQTSLAMQEPAPHIFGLDETLENEIPAITDQDDVNKNNQLFDDLEAFHIINANNINFHAFYDTKGSLNNKALPAGMEQPIIQQVQPASDNKKLPPPSIPQQKKDDTSHTLHRTQRTPTSIKKFTWISDKISPQPRTPKHELSAASDQLSPRPSIHKDKLPAAKAAFTYIIKINGYETEWIPYP
jgi:hypothetical protein